MQPHEVRILLLFFIVLTFSIQGINQRRLTKIVATVLSEQQRQQGMKILVPLFYWFFSIRTAGTTSNIGILILSTIILCGCAYLSTFIIQSCDPLDSRARTIITGSITAGNHYLGQHGKEVSEAIVKFIWARYEAARRIPETQVAPTSDNVEDELDDIIDVDML